MSPYRFHPLSVLLLIAVMVWSAFVWGSQIDDLSDLRRRVDDLEHRTYLCQPLPNDSRVCTTKETP